MQVKKMYVDIMKKAFIISVVLMLLCGVIYPITMTGISQLVFNKKANGSMVIAKGKKVGSQLIGQNFTRPEFFRGRVSSVNYNTYESKDKNKSYGGVASGSQNLAPSNKELQKRVQKDIKEFLKTHPGVKKENIPTDLLTSSGSGLDPNISPEAAKIQIPSVSKASGISEEKLKSIVDKYTEGRSLGIFGQPRVNVLKVNLEISSIMSKR
ncbi:K(+)-transporting ATPase subunit C [Clostridium oryzae]|uniref:Potassium-transporting ATPase KdpC subunit n=1 Tax=Clostridium oryzae TaxID=1450648 RepID=A0A1V4IPK1_9CLOT|nr:K(+)-transporting ATPase subunit C [Clostridium oryzae]OPJ61938.1 potassium-transporting ATPase C chain [Clostridium oryzae]